MLRNYDIFFLLVLTSSYSKAGYKSGTDGAGIMDGVILKLLESMRPHLENIHLVHDEFDTGPQEFGELKGQVNDVIIKGLEKFSVPILKTSFMDLKNLTILAEMFTVEGLYEVNGTLAFPMGKHDIHLFGTGELSAELKNFSVSTKLRVRHENELNVIKEFDIYMNLDGMKVYLSNLMGGGELERVFNKLINDVVLTVFNYYKKPIIDRIKPYVEKIITDLINSNVNRKSIKEEL